MSVRVLKNMNHREHRGEDGQFSVSSAVHSVRSGLPRYVITALVLAVATSAGNAQTPATIDPGMTQAQVIAKLGQPLSVRTFDGSTFLMYRNGCEKTCGMNDIVVLDSGKVVDAVFRSPARHYSGTSSSPRMINQKEAKRSNGASLLKVAEPPPRKKPTEI